MQLKHKTVIIATRNPGKVKEFAQFFGRLGLEVRSLLDYEEIPDVVEDGTTFAENAMIKAKTIAYRLGTPVLADDSGLCVDALGGAPGVYSARYAGEKAADAANNAKLLRELHKLGLSAEPAEPAAGAGGSAAAAPGAAGGPAAGGHGADGAPAPRALSRGRFVCALALVDPSSGETLEVEGACEGVILAEARGSGGFGYDPLLYVPELGRTMAELSVEEKNRMSHRAVALRKLLHALEKGSPGTE